MAAVDAECQITKWVKMKIAILQCDNVLEKFQKAFGNYPQMITNLLTNIEDKLEIEVFDVQLVTN